MENDISKNFNFKCPDSPNCVSSVAKDETHKIEPLKLEGNTEKEIEKIEQIIKNMKRSKIVLKTDKKLHAVFTSFLFRFKDDLFFEADEDKKIIRIKSAARSGYYDFGVNRKRLEKIRDILNEK
ncbi:MAG: DUF1499 domain-containing protein [Thermodesulfobacteriota bacterium]